MNSNRRFFLKAASTVAVGSLLPVAAVAKSISAPLPTKYEMTVSMIKDIVEVADDSREATRRFGVLIEYMLENFESPTEQHIEEARKKLWSKLTMDDVSTLQNTVSDGIYPVAVARIILRNTSVGTPPQWDEFTPVYKNVILKSFQN